MTPRPPHDETSADESVTYARVAFDPPIDVMYARYARQSFVPHAHAEYVIGVIVSGTGLLEYNGGAERHPTGSVFVIPPGLFHTGRSADGRHWSYRALYLPAGYLERATREVQGHAATPSFPRTSFDDPALARLLVRTHHGLMADPGEALAQRPALESLLEDLVCRHATAAPAGPAAEGAVTGSLRAARDFLDAHFLRPVTIDELARVADLSPSYLIRAFHRTFGLAPYVYVEQLRVRHARSLIEAGTPLSAAALMSGFSDQSHLTRRFRRTFGITPGAFARRVRHAEPARSRIMQARGTRSRYAC